MLDRKKILLTHYRNQLVPGPLNGRMVIGYTYYIAGPIAMQQLVNLGALVIKIEGRPLGDPTRQVFSPEMFNALNYGQLSIAIDNKNIDDCQFMAQLLDIADIIVDNRSPSSRKRDATLSTHFECINKRQIYCTISGFPKPDTHSLPSVDASIQAATGFASTNGYMSKKGQHTHLKVGSPILDYTSGLLATTHILANLAFLDNTLYTNTKHQLMTIHASLAGASIWFQTGQVIQALKGLEFFRIGNQDKFAVPFSYYTAKDGLISIATVNEKQFKRFCHNVLKDEIFHKKYPTIKMRIANQEQFEKDLNARLKDNEAAYWHKQCVKHHIPSSPVLNVKQAIKKNYVKPLLKQTSDGRTIVSSGVKVSIAGKPPAFFNKNRQLTHPFSAHKANQDRPTIEKIVRPTQQQTPSIPSKL